MKRFIRVVLAFAAVSFISGFAFGIWRERVAQFEISDKSPLRMLCSEKWIDPEDLSVISQRIGTPIQLYTYARPSELLRQMATSDGNVDVVCASSFVVRGLTQSRWLKKIDPKTLSHFKQIAVDFTHLPFDPQVEYTVPLFWNLYGILRSPSSPPLATLKQAVRSHRLSVWGDELNVLYLMNLTGLDIATRLNREDELNLDQDMRSFIQATNHMVRPLPIPETLDEVMAKADWAILPASHAARFTGAESKYEFLLPDDGGAVEIGVLAVGEKSARAEEALLLINELIAPEHALRVHRRLGAGVLHTPLAHLDSILPMQRPEALRDFPLTRMHFPDLALDAIPRLQKIFDEILASNSL